MTAAVVDRASVGEAADAFMDEFTEWAANYYSDRSTDIRGPLAHVVAGLSRVASADRVSAFEQECSTLIAEHEHYLAMPGTNAVASMPPDRLASAWAALDEALAPFDDELLVTARQAVAAAEAALAELRRALSAAVAGSDVERVLELREQVEFTAPNRVDDARAALRLLEVAKARVVLERPARRAEVAITAAESAATAHAEAERALVAATEALRVANHRRLTPARVRAEAQERLREAERLSADEARAAEADKQSRLRRLTGLPA